MEKWEKCTARIELVPKYDSASEFSDGLAVVCNQHCKYGYINKNGEEVIKCQFKKAFGFNYGLAAVQNEKGLWGYIEMDGKLKIPYKFLQAATFNDEVAYVQDENGKFGYIDTSGNYIIEPMYSEASHFRCGYAQVKNGKDIRYSLIDKTGQVIGKYNEINIHHDGTIIASRSKVEYKDFDYQNPDHYPSIYYKVSKEGHEQLIPTDELGIKNIVISRFNTKFPMRYKSSDGKYGYIDENFNIIIPAIYNFAAEFCDDVAEVDIDLKTYACIDKTGKILYEAPSHGRLHFFTEGLSIEEDEKKYLKGFVDKTGKRVIPCKYTKTGVFSEGVSYVKEKNGDSYYIDKVGKKVIDVPMIYKTDIYLPLPDSDCYIQTVTASTEVKLKNKCKKLYETYKDFLQAIKNAEKDDIKKPKIKD